MYKRVLEKELKRVARQYPVVTLTGPRQSGKTTLVRTSFRNHEYTSLEEPDVREFALEDPRGFLDQFSGPVVLDEVQRAPDLFSYIQTSVDEKDSPGQFILSGSQNFLLLESISQSLAGRTAILHLLPLSLGEIERRKSFPLAKMGRELPRGRRPSQRKVMETLFRGFYPRIHDKDLDPGRWYANYYRTYIERDVRDILNVGDLESFGRFVRLCAGRNGQLLNLTSLSNDCGITHTTAGRWLSVLEASFLITLLRPHYRNFGKRLIKSPKLYFLDTGLLCYLLRIRTPDDLRFHASRGAIFESYVHSELSKNFLNQGLESDLYFWQDSAGHEIDILVEQGDDLVPIEIKSGQTISSDYFKSIDLWRKLAGDAEHPAALVYAGDKTLRRKKVTVYSWSSL